MLQQYLFQPPSPIVILVIDILKFCHKQYDIRSAELAKNSLQNTSFQGRPIDVHYALPKEEDQKKDDDAENNTGFLLVSIKGLSIVPTAEAIKLYFEKWGELKDIKDSKHP